MSTRIWIESTGEMLHHGPEAPSAFERECAALECAQRGEIIQTPWGPGEVRGGAVFVHGRVTRPVA